MVDGNEALWRGPYEHQAAAEKAGFNLGQRLTILMMKPSGASPKDACQLDTETGFVLLRASRLSRRASAARDHYKVRYEGQTVGRTYSLC
jgi:hypothetical protein